jgi:hypothetical protein
MTTNSLNWNQYKTKHHKVNVYVHYPVDIYFEGRPDLNNCESRVKKIFRGSEKAYVLWRQNHKHLPGEQVIFDIK